MQRAVMYNDTGKDRNSLESSKTTSSAHVSTCSAKINKGTAKAQVLLVTEKVTKGHAS